MNVKKSTLCKYIIVHFDHFIAWFGMNLKLKKKEANYTKRRTAESFFINQRATEVNVSNRIDGANKLGCIFDTGSASFPNRLHDYM